MSTQTVETNQVAPADLHHDDKIILDGRKAIIDNIYKLDNGSYGIEVSMGAMMDTVVIAPGDTVTRA